MTKTLLVFWDDGHGIETPGKRTPYISEIGRAIKENEFNSAVVKQAAHLTTKLSTKVISILVAPTDSDTPLITRTNTANRIYKEYVSKYGQGNVNAIYVSVHYDAFDSAFNGYDPEGLTVFVQKGFSKGESGRLARSINKYLAQGTPQQNRGVKEGNYHVLRETSMPAVLTENGFMDNKREALLMIDKNFQQEVAEEHVKGICEYFGIPYDVQKEPVKVEEVKEEEEDVKFTSPTLKEKFESRTRSKATSKTIDDAAVKILGYQSKLDKDGRLSDGDLAALSTELAVKLLKK